MTLTLERTTIPAVLRGKGRRKEDKGRRKENLGSYWNNPDERGPWLGPG